MKTVQKEMATVSEVITYFNIRNQLSFKITFITLSGNSVSCSILYDDDFGSVADGKHQIIQLLSMEGNNHLNSLVGKQFRVSYFSDFVTAIHHKSRDTAFVQF